MTQIISSVLIAFRNLFNLKIQWILIWPLLVSCLIWISLSHFFWAPLSGWIVEFISTTQIQDWLEESYLLKIANGLEGLVNILLFITLVIITTLIITALFVMPSLINFVAKQHYPYLERKRGGSVMGNVKHVLSALLVFLLLWSIALPLWFFGIGIVISFIAAAYFNQRLFCYDALSEHASSEELNLLLASNKPALWSLGLLTGFLQLIPFVNLVAPTWTALAFIHYELSRLDKLRSVTRQENPTTNLSINSKRMNE